METDRIFGDDKQEISSYSEAEVLLGRTHSKEMSPIDPADYFVSANGDIGFKARDLARLALANGSDSIIWLRSARIPIETVRDPESTSPSLLFARGAVEINSYSRDVRLNGVSVEMPKQQFDLLHFFAENHGLALSREQLLTSVWGDTFHYSERVVDVVVSEIRKKLAEYKALIKTRRGYGYVFEDIDSPENT